MRERNIQNRKHFYQPSISLLLPLGILCVKQPGCSPAFLLALPQLRGNIYHLEEVLIREEKYSQQINVL